MALTATSCLEMRADRPSLGGCEVSSAVEVASVGGSFVAPMNDRAEKGPIP